jgi:hypothetical protein
MHSYISLTEHGAGFEIYFITPDNNQDKTNDHEHERYFKI